MEYSDFTKIPLLADKMVAVETELSTLNMLLRENKNFGKIINSIYVISCMCAYLNGYLDSSIVGVKIEADEVLVLKERVNDITLSMNTLLSTKH